MAISSGQLATLCATGLASAMLVNGVAHGEWDLPGLQKQVQHVTEQVNSNDARITKAESDIKQLQNNTNTAPASSPTAVPVS
jgi:hypothetical protein